MIVSLIKKNFNVNINITYVIVLPLANSGAGERVRRARPNLGSIFSPKDLLWNLSAELGFVKGTQEKHIHPHLVHGIYD